MRGLPFYCRVSAVGQHPETLGEATAAKQIAGTPGSDSMKQAFNEAWERVLRLGIEYGYRAAERGEPLTEAWERVLRATDVRGSNVRTMSREDVCQTERK